MINEVKELIKQQNFEDAMNLVKSRETLEIKDSQIHLEWAKICEELNLIDGLILELNLVLRDAPDNIEIYKKLAEVYLDDANFDKALKTWQKITELQPDDIYAYKQAGSILEDMKRIDEAKELYTKAYENTKNELFNNFIKKLDLLESQEEPKEDKAGLIPTEDQLVRFTTLFSGREGVYPRQWASPTGESGYTPIKEPLTLQVAKNHILGNHTIGVYQLRMDNTVSFIAFDIDISKFHIAKAITDEKLWQKAVENTHKLACKFVDIGAANEIPVYIEDSGFKGRHCWIFFENPIGAKVAKKFALLFLNQIKNSFSEIHIEVFPKQTFVTPEGFGNLIKLPLGIHRKTGKRSMFIKPDNDPYRNQLKFLDEIKQISKPTVYNFIQRFQPQEKQESVTEEDISSGQEQGLTLQGSPTLIEEYDIETDREVQYILLKCPVIHNITDKINKQNEISNEERIVLTHTLGHLGKGVEAVNALLKRCINANPSFFVKSKFTGNPISCAKIRARIPDITSQVPCNCQFPPSFNMYPTPLIHVKNLKKEGSFDLIGLTVNSLQFQHALDEYIKLKQKMREVEILINTYEQKFDEVFKQAEVGEISTSIGILERIVSQDGKINYQLKI